MFTLFLPYLICICIFYVIWQLNALNGFSFQLLIYAISAIKNIIFLKRKQITCSFLETRLIFSCIFRIAL